MASGRGNGSSKPDMEWDISRWFGSSEPEPTHKHSSKPDMEEKDKDQEATTTALAVGAAAGVAALAVWGISKCLESSEREPTYKQKMMMKAPRAAAAVGAALAAWGMSKLFGISSTTALAVVAAAWVAVLVAWGISRYKQSSKPDMEEKDTTSALAVGAAAGVAVMAAWGISKWLESSEPEATDKEKMMKAPGRDYLMPRKDFEESPRTYFRDLRGKE